MSDSGLPRSFHLTTVEFLSLLCPQFSFRVQRNSHEDTGAGGGDRRRRGRRSTLYHLAKKGWSDVVLIERKELTSGSTWHAAGLLPLFNLSYSVGQIHKYSVKL